MGADSQVPDRRAQVQVRIKRRLALDKFVLFYLYLPLPVYSEQWSTAKRSSNPLNRRSVQRLLWTAPVPTIPIRNGLDNGLDIHGQDEKVLFNGCGNPKGPTHLVALEILEMTFNHKLTTVGLFLPKLCGDPDPKWHISCYRSYEKHGA